VTNANRFLVLNKKEQQPVDLASFGDYSITLFVGLYHDDILANAECYLAKHIVMNA
jgi:hypothetical protein